MQLTDRLPEIIESAWQDVTDLLREYFVENGGDLPCLHNDLDYNGSVSEIIDSAVPIYTNQLNELAYFHHDAAIAKLVDTFGSADGDWPSGPFAAGLYSLIEEGINERWHADAEDLWDEFTESLDCVAVRKFALAYAKQQSEAKQEAEQEEAA
ncbi:MAG: hypothetical protein EBV86_13745 [Marivivens sp.]|nr:hypothetical protein [Marivivens sp.]